MRAAISFPEFIWNGLIPPGCHGPTDPAASASRDFGTRLNRSLS